MSKLVPFRALRPTPAAAPHVASVPYDVVTADEARALADGNPLSFLHVSRAEIDLPPGTDPYSSAVYDRAVTNLARLTTAAPLVIEDTPSLYIYRLRMGAHEQTGVAGCYSLDEYDRDLILKHERTRRDKEDDRTRHMVALRAQTGPVFLTYRASPLVDAAVQTTVRTAPALFDVTTSDQVEHTVWRVEPARLSPLVAAFAGVPALYVADGHHRAASAARARRELGEAAGRAGAWDTFLGVAFPDNQVQILPYNRVVKDLGAHTAASFLAALHEHAVRDGAASLPDAGEVSMYLAGRWHRFALRPPAAGGGASDRLDVGRLQDQVLTPILGIGDVRTDPRIDFVGGARGTSELERLVDGGSAAVAFALHPVGLTDLMAIADAGGIMPPKSTWFEPKLRDGLLSHPI